MLPKEIARILGNSKRMQEHFTPAAVKKEIFQCEGLTSKHGFSL